MPLRHSRRCPRPVLESALAVVRAFDPDRRDKGVFTYEAPDGPGVAIHRAPSAQAEAAEIVRIVTSATPERDVLVLVPTRRHAASIVERLRAARIPFSAPAAAPGDGPALLGRLAAWLRDEHDSLALRECIQASLDGPGSPLPSKSVRDPEMKRQRERGLCGVSTLWREVIAGKRSLWQCLESRADDGVLGALRGTFGALRAGDGRAATGLLGRKAEPCTRGRALRCSSRRSTRASRGLEERHPVAALAMAQAAVLSPSA